MPLNPYDILGVSRDASADDIKKAYRKLSKEWHPDKHKGEKKAEEKYKQINQSYEILSDPKKKQMYDQFGSTDGQAGFGGQGNPFQGGFGGFEGMEDLFETFFGGGGGRGGAAAQQGGDQEVMVTISFAEAYTGVQKTVRISTVLACETCNGSGSEAGSNIVTCSQCSGSGQVTRSSQSFFGTIRQSVLCDQCRGSGSVPEKPCARCSGEGRVSGSRDVAIAIPPGIDDGQTLRIRGEGQAGRQGNAAGDLYVLVRITPDAVLQRQGADIYMQYTIPVVDAVLGTEVTVQAVQGPVTLKVPAGSQPEQVLRVKGKGMPVLNTSRFGDLYVTIHVEIPHKLGRTEKKKWEELRS